MLGQVRLVASRALMFGSPASDDMSRAADKRGGRNGSGEDYLLAVEQIVTTLARPIAALDAVPTRFRR